MKDELVDTIIQEFFETFPERDSLQHATGDLVLRLDVRDKTAFSEFPVCLSGLGYK
jgi:hypothetical protein